MKRTISVTPVLGLSLLLLSSCATYSVVSDFDTSCDFSSFRTFAWVSNAAEFPEDPRFDSALLDNRVRNAVVETLTAKGYREAAPDAADFHIGYYVNVQEKTDVYAVNDFYGYAPGWGWGGTDWRVTQYDVGTLILDIVRPEAKHLIWRGSAKAVVQDSATPEERDARVREAVELILAQFPPD